MLFNNGFQVKANFIIHFHLDFHANKECLKVLLKVNFLKSKPFNHDGMKLVSSLDSEAAAAVRTLASFVGETFLRSRFKNCSNDFLIGLSFYQNI